MAQRPVDLSPVGRDAWGARYAAGFGARPIPCAEAWLHHTVTLAPDLAFTDLNADSVDDDEARAMRQVEAIGQQRFGAGFSYNLAVMPSGRLYVGCGVRRIGAHTSKRNTKALGVVLLGDYSTVAPPPPMVATLVRLLQFAKQEGWLQAARFAGGHRDVPGASTACPGDEAYALLPTINDQAARPPATPTAPLEDTVYRAIKAGDRIALTAPGYFRHLTPAEWAAAQAGGVCNVPPDAVSTAEWDALRVIAHGTQRG